MLEPLNTRDNPGYFLTGSAQARRIIDQVDHEQLDIKAAQLEIEYFWAGALRHAVIDGDVENGSLMAGQSVGLVTRKQPTSEILQELVDQAVAVLAARETSDWAGAAE